MDNKIKDIPKTQASITLQPFETAMTLNDKGEIYLSPLKDNIVETMDFQDGHIFIKGKENELTDIEIQNFSTKEYINELDMTTLRMFYTIIFNEYEKSNFQDIQSEIKIYLPDLFNVLGIKGNQDKSRVLAFVSKINKFKNLVGVIKQDTGDKRRKEPATSYYALLNFNYYDEDTNTFSFSAPFLEQIAKNVYVNSLEVDNELHLVLDEKGNPKRKPCHSYLIKTEIGKERNKAAVENVYIIVTTIEQAGGYTAHISAKTIIERNPFLLQQLEDALPKHRNQILARTFKKTWELLHTMTLLEETYPNIKLPDPNDKDNIPKLKALEDYVYEFPHGKKSTKKAK